MLRKKGENDKEARGEWSVLGVPYWTRNQTRGSEPVWLERRIGISKQDGKEREEIEGKTIFQKLVFRSVRKNTRQGKGEKKKKTVVAVFHVDCKQKICGRRLRK